MLTTNYTEKLLGLKDVILNKVEEIGSEKHIYLTMNRRIHNCPNCNAETDTIHDYRIQKVKDVSIFGLNAILHINKRRYVCPICNKKFAEKIPFLPKYQRTTNRLWAHVINSMGDVKSMKQVAKENNISSTSVARIFDNVTFSLPKLPPIIGIDEFKGNSGGEKFNCILTDPAKHKILDILPQRKAESLYQYFSNFPNRHEVKIVTMDMSKLFKSVVNTSFPHADIVADKFHVARQVTWAFENTRKRVQKDLHKNSRIKFKASRRLLLKRKSQLKPEQMDKVASILLYHKDLGAAYYLKEAFYDFLDSKDEKEARQKLKEWFVHAEIANIEEFNKCIKTFQNWHQEILNAFKYGLTNAYTEGCNNLIKVIKRTGYGLPNVKRFRARILYISQCSA